MALDGHDGYIKYRSFKLLRPFKPYWDFKRYQDVGDSQDL